MIQKCQILARRTSRAAMLSLCLIATSCDLVSGESKSDPNTLPANLSSMTDREFKDFVHSTNVGMYYSKTALIHHLIIHRMHTKLRLLLEHDVSTIELPTNEEVKHTPLVLAIMINDEYAAKLLLAAGASPHNTVRWRQNLRKFKYANRLISGIYPLYISVGYEGDSARKIFHMLIEAGADVDAADSNGRTPIMLAALANHSYYVEQLIGYGADANLQDRSGETPLHLVMVFINNIEDLSRYGKTIDALIAGGASWNIRDKAGEYPIDKIESISLKDHVMSLYHDSLPEK